MLSTVILTRYYLYTLYVTFLFVQDRNNSSATEGLDLEDEVFQSVRPDSATELANDKVGNWLDNAVDLESSSDSENDPLLEPVLRSAYRLEGHFATARSPTGKPKDYIEMNFKESNPRPECSESRMMASLGPDHIDDLPHTRIATGTTPTSENIICNTSLLGYVPLDITQHHPTSTLIASNPSGGHDQNHDAGEVLLSSHEKKLHSKPLSYIPLESFPTSNDNPVTTSSHHRHDILHESVGDNLHESVEDNSPTNLHWLPPSILYPADESR